MLSERSGNGRRSASITRTLPNAGCDGTSRRMVERYARKLICEQFVKSHDPTTAQSLLAKVQPGLLTEDIETDGATIHTLRRYGRVAGW